MEPKCESVSCRQSPIPLYYRKAIIVRDSERLSFINYDMALKDWTVCNDGVTVKATSPELIRADETVAKIRGKGLPGTYIAQGFYIHWGSHPSRGSEHTIEDRRYSMEMHIVHINEKYSTLDKALQYRDGLLILAILYLETWRPFYPDPYAQLAERVKLIQEGGASTMLPHDFTLATVMKGCSLDRYYTYDGSLTKWDHEEVVSWIVFGFPVRINSTLLIELRKLKNFFGKPASDNYRELQALENRQVMLVLRK